MAHTHSVIWCDIEADMEFLWYVREKEEAEMSSGKGIHQKSKKLLSKLAFIQQCFHSIYLILSVSLNLTLFSYIRIITIIKNEFRHTILYYTYIWNATNVRYIFGVQVFYENININFSFCHFWYFPLDDAIMRPLMEGPFAFYWTSRYNWISILFVAWKWWNSNFSL